jgi:hypothetical protein
LGNETNQGLARDGCIHFAVYARFSPSVNVNQNGFAVKHPTPRGIPSQLETVLFRDNEEKLGVSVGD